MARVRSDWSVLSQDLDILTITLVVSNRKGLWLLEAKRGLGKS